MTRISQATGSPKGAAMAAGAVVWVTVVLLDELFQDAFSRADDRAEDTVAQMSSDTAGARGPGHDEPGFPVGVRFRDESSQLSQTPPRTNAGSAPPLVSDEHLDGAGHFLPLL